MTHFLAFQDLTLAQADVQIEHLSRDLSKLSKDQRLELVSWRLNCNVNILTVAPSDRRTVA